VTLIYEPEEDSFFLKEVIEKKVPLLIKKNELIKVLEIGVGSGIQLKTFFNVGVKRENIFGVDINKDAVLHCKNLGFNCFESDLFSKVKEKFDLIIFNPPYLPTDENESEDSRLITTGGKNGSEVINLFLKDAKNYLNKDGRIFLLVSSLSKKIDWRRYEKKLLGKKKIFFEELKVYELKRIKNIKKN
jgi:release factor glutamine methyltransferase